MSTEGLAVKRQGGEAGALGAEPDYQFGGEMQGIGGASAVSEEDYFAAGAQGGREIFPRKGRCGATN